MRLVDSRLSSVGRVTLCVSPLFVSSQSCSLLQVGTSSGFLPRLIVLIYG